MLYFTYEPVALWLGGRGSSRAGTFDLSLTKPKEGLAMPQIIVENLCMEIKSQTLEEIVSQSFG